MSASYLSTVSRLSAFFTNVTFTIIHENVKKRHRFRFCPVAGCNSSAIRLTSVAAGQTVTLSMRTLPVFIQLNPFPVCPDSHSPKIAGDNGLCPTLSQAVEHLSVGMAVAVRWNTELDTI